MTDCGPVVFVIDDDVSVRKAVGRLLKSAGMRALAFASADAFLKQPLPDAPASPRQRKTRPRAYGVCRSEAGTSTHMRFSCY